MNPDDDRASEDEQTEATGEVEDLEATDEEGSAVKGGLQMRKAGGKQDNF